MVQPLYFEKHRLMVGNIGDEPRPEIMETFGVMRHEDDELLTKPVKLKDDLHWGEVSTLQVIMKQADFWTGFPESGIWLVSAEFQPGTISQRIDLLYIRDDGTIYPCELKLGGTESDSHGQIQRYISDLKRQPITRDWVLDKHRAYLTRKYTALEEKGVAAARSGAVEQNIRFDMGAFEKRIENILHKRFRLAPKTGVIIDEEFKPATVQVVEDLNADGHAITLLKLQAFVHPDWTHDTEAYRMRLEFNHVTPRRP